MVKAGRRRRLRRQVSIGAAAAAVLILAIAAHFRATVPELPASSPEAASPRPPMAFQIVTTAAAAPLFETVPTAAGLAFEEVRTAQLVGPLERLRDEELLAAPGVVAIVGHQGGVRRLILATPASQRTLD
jgi:hypothetical protein